MDRTERAAIAALVLSVLLLLWVNSCGKRRIYEPYVVIQRDTVTVAQPDTLPHKHPHGRK